MTALAVVTFIRMVGGAGRSERWNVMLVDNYPQSHAVKVVTVLNYPTPPKFPICSTRTPSHPKCKETKVIELYYLVKKENLDGAERDVS